jgi:plasmid stabilization system protein ParE
MSYTVVITPAAERELEKEIDYSLSQWGKQHAERYRKSLLLLVQKIAQAPLSYPPRNTAANPLRWTRYKGNRIVFSVDEASKAIRIIGFPSVYKSL